MCLNYASCTCRKNSCHNFFFICRNILPCVPFLLCILQEYLNCCRNISYTLFRISYMCRKHVSGTFEKCGPFFFWKIVFLFKWERGNKTICGIKRQRAKTRELEKESMQLATLHWLVLDPGSITWTLVKLQAKLMSRMTENVIDAFSFR